MNLGNMLAWKMPLPEGTRMVPTVQTPAQQQVPQTPGLLSGSVTKTPQRDWDPYVKILK